MQSGVLAMAVLDESYARDLALDGRLDAEDMARLLTGFRGQIPVTPGMRSVRSSPDGSAAAYVFDEVSGMVYILD